MKIRTENTADINAIEQLTYAAFENHPHHEPGAKPTEHLIVNKLRESDALSLSLVAEDETGIIGHIAFSPVNVNGEFLGWYGLAPVSVSPEHQGKGIGSKLIREGLAQMKANGAKGMVLLGEPEYYNRFGFIAQSELILEGVPAEYFLSQKLSGEPIPSGEISFHPSFG